MDETISALLEERRGYVARGLDSRVRQVDAELARLGYRVEPEAAVRRDAETAVAPKPRGRRATK